jgi:phenylalanyl-tRNA synthetase beta chain
MGGLDSEVTGDTTTILLESAHFDATAILKTARRLSLWTEASRRFEKGMDRNMTVPALLRCAQLFAQLGAGTPASTVIDAAVPRPEKGTVQLRVPRVNELLGVELTVEEVGDLLERLGFVAEPVEASRGSAVLSVGLSSHRPDVETEIDLVEEVARLYGYDKLPTTVPTGAPSGDFPAYEDQLIRTIRRLLT